MLNKNQFNILIIDDKKEFNTKLYLALKAFGYKVSQAFDDKQALELVDKKKDDLNLVILNIDFDDKVSTKIFKTIQEKTTSKILLLSSEDIGIKREEYFKQGVLDYHLTSKKLDHIVDDIDETIKRLEKNNKETILIIDDSKLICKLIKDLLESRNYNVHTAHNAQDGLAILREEEISLLILDMELPDIHGLQLLEGLRDMYLLNEFMVLVISGNDNPSIVREALKGGASNFLKKPFLYEEFLLKVDLLVKSSRGKKTVLKQKKQIENTLASFKELVNSTISAMFIFEKNTCVDCNKEALDLLGLNKKEELINKKIFEIFTDVSDEHKEELLDDKVDHYFEDNIVSQNGKTYQVQIKERNIFIDGKLLKIVAAMDITDIKRNERMLSQQSKMASMGEMIGNIAHQWRQPLTAISVAAGGIKLNYEFDMEDRDETIKELDNIVKNTQFLSSTIEDFQNFLKTDRTTSTFSLKDTVKKTLAIIKANIESHRINIVENYEDNIQINGIQNDLVQVLLNIINNSVDILKIRKEELENRSIVITIKKENNDLLICVHDTAGGVPKDIIDKVFEPYFTTKHQAQGTGLGLYMTHKIINNMNGNINVTNENIDIDGVEYLGAKFVVTLPLNF